LTDWTGKKRGKRWVLFAQKKGGEKNESDGGMKRVRALERLKT